MMTALTKMHYKIYKYLFLKSSLIVENANRLFFFSPRSILVIPIKRERHMLTNLTRQEEGGWANADIGCQTGEGRVANADVG